MHFQTTSGVHLHHLKKKTKKAEIFIDPKNQISQKKDLKRHREREPDFDEVVEPPFSHELQVFKRQNKPKTQNWDLRESEER